MFVELDESIGMIWFIKADWSLLLLRDQSRRKWFDIYIHSLILKTIHGHTCDQALI
jgi:hypothetical protein